MAALHELVCPLRAYKGTCIFEKCEIGAIESMEIHDDDVWVLTFPRSGTTLTQEIVYLLHHKCDTKSALTRPLDERFPFLDLCIPDMPHFQGLRAVQSQKTPRLIKSHLHYHVLPPALFKSKCKKIYVMRNPKDVFVSGLMLTKYLKLAAPDKSPEEFLETWLQDEEYATPWWRHVRDFWLHRDDPTILWLTYEHMVKDLPEAIRQIASHLDVKVTEKDVATLTEHCSFSNMKQNPSTNASWIGENSYVDKQFGGHIRKGRVGNWKEHLSEAAGNTIDAMVEDKLGDLDIQFDYGH